MIPETHGLPHELEYRIVSGRRRWVEVNFNGLRISQLWGGKDKYPHNYLAEDIHLRWYLLLAALQALIKKMGVYITGEDFCSSSRGSDNEVVVHDGMGQLVCEYSFMHIGKIKIDAVMIIGIPCLQAAWLSVIFIEDRMKLFRVSQYSDADFLHSFAHIQDPLHPLIKGIHFFFKFL